MLGELLPACILGSCTAHLPAIIPQPRNHAVSTCIATVLLVLFALVIGLQVPVVTAAENSAPAGFTALFNGQDLDGWHGMGTFDFHKLDAMTPEEREKNRVPASRI